MLNAEYFENIIRASVYIGFIFICFWISPPCVIICSFPCCFPLLRRRSCPLFVFLPLHFVTIFLLLRPSPERKEGRKKENRLADCCALNFQAAFPFKFYYLTLELVLLFPFSFFFHTCVHVEIFSDSFHSLLRFREHTLANNEGQRVLTQFRKVGF